MSEQHQLYVYDDAVARSWFPFSLTRPVGELLFGAFTQRKRAEHVLLGSCLGHVTDTALDGFDEPGAAPAIALNQIDTSGARVFLNSRVVLAVGQKKSPIDLPGHGVTLRVGDDTAGFYCPAGQPNPTERELLEGSAHEGVELTGKVLRQVWELMSSNSAQVTEDVTNLYHADRRWSAVPPGVLNVGEPRLVLHGEAVIEPGVVLDFRDGPIVIMPGAEVRAYTRLSGPVFIGTRTTVFGGRLSGVSIGPHCKVHGELEETVILGYSNKAHDGFIGHAYLGAWVNLGALTTNSDLKNNYGSVRLSGPSGEIDTGRMKIGCFLGDHVKTAIGTMINTGTLIGPGSNIFGGMPPKFVPPFSWGVDLGPHTFDKFVATAEMAMKRRGVPLSASQRNLLQRAWQRGREMAEVES